MGYCFVKRVSDKPAVGDVKIDFIYSSAQRGNSKDMLYKDNFEQDDGVYAWSAIVLAVKGFDQVVNFIKVNRFVYLS